MQKFVPQQINVPNQPAARQGRGAVADTAQTEQIAQLESMIENSPQMERQGNLAGMMNTSSVLTSQRKLSDIMLNSPRQATQQKMTSGIHNSPLAVIQHRKYSNLFGTMQRAEDEEPIQGKFFADEATTEGEEISKAAFLDQLRSTLQGVADQELAAIQQTSENCPYLAKWFAHYQDKDAAYIQKAIARYAPDTEGAADVNQYIDLLAARVRQGLKEHIATGSTDAVPTELMDEKHAPEDFAHIAAEQSEDQTTQLACLANLCNGGGGGGQGGGQQIVGGQQAPVVAPPPANAAINPAGTHYAIATPNLGAAGGTFTGFNIFTMNHVAAETFYVSSFEVGTEVGFHDIFNYAPIGGATDLITWHLCRYSAVTNFEVTTLVNLDLINHLTNHFGMLPGGPGAFIGNRVAVLALATARLNGWVLPP